MSTLHVGPQRAITSLAEAARLARDGDTVEVDAADYRGDVAVWRQHHLTIRGKEGGTGRATEGGQPHLWAEGKSAQGKGIFVLQGGHITLENLAFLKAAVPSLNGAGIRVQAGHLVARNCRFIDNENGILCDPTVQAVELEYCHFSGNGHGDGYSHGAYIGAIELLKVTGCVFEAGKVGHLLKSRARANYIFCNRLTDGPRGTSSYELEFPNGGIAVVVGNTIQQSASSLNSGIVSYGAEGLHRWPVNEVFIVHNTIVNDKLGAQAALLLPKGADRLVALNNLLVGLDPARAFAAAQAAATRHQVDLNHSGPRPAL